MCKGFSVGIKDMVLDHELYEQIDQSIEDARAQAMLVQNGTNSMSEQKRANGVMIQSATRLASWSPISSRKTTASPHGQCRKQGEGFKHMPDICKCRPAKCRG